MNIFDIIEKSQNSEPLSQEEIHWLVHSFIKGELPDYQMAAWLATVYLNPLKEEQTLYLTETLLKSGHQLAWTEPTVDKHSTGGIGDKTSLIIAPLVSSLGYKVPMMAGRGLGHTGGTIDKLEAIGVRTEYSVEEFAANVTHNGTSIIGQSKDFCPADKKIYALRDATHTVANIPLICASIMSKKIAEGVSGLALDVKYGTGAFMNTLESAQTLAEKLMHIGHRNHVNTICVLSSMNQPLGRYIGNKLEILECIEIMKTPEKVYDEYRDTIVLSCALSAVMVYTLDGGSLDEAYQKCHSHLMSGQVFSHFEKMIEYQNGDLSLVAIDAKKQTLYAKADGYFRYTDTKSLGFASLMLGAGRLKKEDQLNFDVGLYCHKKMGDPVKSGDPLFDLYTCESSNIEACEKYIENSFSIEAKPTEDKLIHSILSYQNGSITPLQIENL